MEHCNYSIEYLRDLFAEGYIIIPSHLRNNIINKFNEDILYFSKILGLYQEELPVKLKAEMYFDFNYEKCEYVKDMEEHKFQPYYFIYKNLKEYYQVYNKFINLLVMNDYDETSYVFNDSIDVYYTDLEDEFNKTKRNYNLCMWEIIHNLLSGETRKIVETIIKPTVEDKLTYGVSFMGFDEENDSYNVYNLVEILQGENFEKLYLLKLVTIEGDIVRKPIYTVKKFNELFLERFSDYPKNVFTIKDYQKMRKSFEDDFKFFIEKFDINNEDGMTFEELYNNQHEIEKGVDDYVFNLFLQYYMMYHKFISNLQINLLKGCACINNAMFNILKEDYKWLVNKDRDEIYNTLVKGKLKEMILFTMFE